MYHLIDKNGKKVKFQHEGGTIKDWTNSYYQVVKEKNRLKKEGKEVYIQEDISKSQLQAKKELKAAELRWKKAKLEDKKEDEEEGSEITDEELDDFEAAILGEEFRGI